jgi:ZIP family zinc transporter
MEPSGPVSLEPVLLGLLGSLGAGLMTGLGALPVVFQREPSARVRDASLGFAAGVMLTASFFSLIVPALEVAEQRHGDGPAPALIVCVSIAIGMTAVAALNALLPHEHFVSGREGPRRASLDRIWLFVFAITIHNIPEGMSVGVAFGTGEPSHGWPLALGIGLQNAPEGLAVAVALVGEGYGRARAAWIALLTGLVEPVGGLIAALTVTVSQTLLPWALAFAAGAMLFVINHEIVPETHRRGHEATATLGFGIGLIAMLFLDAWLG